MYINIIYLIFWRVFGKTIFKLTPSCFFKIRVLILKLFGSKIKWSSLVYPSSEIYSPRNLYLDSRSCLSYKTIIYNVAPIKIGIDSTISQYSFLCTASHDIDDKQKPLKSSAIIIGDNVWIGADTYINRGCKIFDNSVVAARSTIFKNVYNNEVVSSTMPHRIIKNRKFIQY